MDDAEESKGLEPTVGDGIHRIAKAAISAVPLISGPAVELFSALLTPPLDRRRDEWLSYCYRGLKQLEEKIEGFTVEGLFQDEAFVTAFVRASRAAVNDHQKEKLKALRNAILNSARSTDLDENRQLMFLNLIDRMTELHLRVLIFLSNPKKPLREMGVSDMKGTRGGSLLPYLREYFHSPKSDLLSLGMFVADLQASRLIVADVYGEKTGMSLYAGRATPAGEQLVAFITSPLPEDDPETGES